MSESVGLYHVIVTGRVSTTVASFLISLGPCLLTITMGAWWRTGGMMGGCSRVGEVPGLGASITALSCTLSKLMNGENLGPSAKWIISDPEDEERLDQNFGRCDG
jgi:hypothetical protein